MADPTSQGRRGNLNQGSRSGGSNRQRDSSGQSTSGGRSRRSRGEEEEE